MTAPVTVSEKDLRTLLGIIRDHRTDLPPAGLPESLLTDLTSQVRCDNISMFNVGYTVAHEPGWFMQEIPAVNYRDADEEATDWWHWPEFSCYPTRTGDLRSVRKVSDFYSARQWHSTRPHTDFFGPLGFEHALQVCVPGKFGSGICSFLNSGAAITFYREPGPDFSERDRLLLELLGPHIHQAYLQAERRRDGVPRLTSRHLDVLRLIADGNTNAQIARRLGISEGTVRTHLETIYERLQVSSRAAAVARVFPDGPSA
jgi:DNA-binding CsgD family transcriptional regulator